MSHFWTLVSRIAIARLSIEMPLKICNPFQFSVVFHIETSHLFCTANQVGGFYMKYNTVLKGVKLDM